MKAEVFMSRIAELEDELVEVYIKLDLAEADRDEAQEYIKVLKAHLQRVHEDIQYPISGVA